MNFLSHMQAESNSYSIAYTVPFHNWEIHVILANFCIKIGTSTHLLNRVSYKNTNLVYYNDTFSVLSMEKDQIESLKKDLLRKFIPETGLFLFTAPVFNQRKKYIPEQRLQVQSAVQCK